MRIPDGWSIQKLDDVCEDITVGHVGPMADEYVEVGIPFLRSQNIEPFRVNLEGMKFITEAFHAKLKKCALKPGDVVVIRTGYPGTASVVPKSLPVANCADLVVIRPAPAVDARFLAAIFNSTWGQSRVAGQLVGVAQQHFNVGAARRLEVALPPISSQRRIADILSAYDDLIDNNTKRIKKLEDIACLLYREWFVNFRFPGHENVRLVTSPLGKVPDGWRVTELREVLTVHRGKSYKGTELADEGGLPFVNLKCFVRNGGFRRDGIKRFTGEAKPHQLVRVGDLVMAVTDMTQERRIVARAASIPRLNEPVGAISMDVVKLEPRNVVEREFLYAMLRYSSFPDQVKKHANGANVLHLNPDQIESFVMCSPPSRLADRFGKILAPLLEQADVLALKNLSLSASRDLLLPRLISGEVSVAAQANG